MAKYSFSQLSLFLSFFYNIFFFVLLLSFNVLAASILFGPQMAKFRGWPIVAHSIEIFDCCWYVMPYCEYCIEIRQRSKHFFSLNIQSLNFFRKLFWLGHRSNWRLSRHSQCRSVRIVNDDDLLYPNRFTKSMNWRTSREVWPGQMERNEQKPPMTLPKQLRSPG